MTACSLNAGDFIIRVKAVFNVIPNQTANIKNSKKLVIFESKIDLIEY